MINDELKRELELFAKRWELEDKLDSLEKMLEISYRMKEFKLMENEVSWLQLLDEYSDNYCLSSYGMLLEFMEFIYSVYN